MVLRLPLCKLHEIGVRLSHGGTPLLRNSSGGVPPLGLRTRFEPSIKPPSIFSQSFHLIDAKGFHKLRIGLF